eukprot:TRINITY_DN2475_c0_g1_i7.p1 TRINITY_DN2475_c0_g1~~TRINITY_DN2475_c0_g1_i7.p1  ORF type:complete len:278 (-),score=37.01 TRINITY_DN2475_c0_g1_i7:186-1019(-)
MCNEKLVNIPTVTDAITYFQAISFDPKIQSEAVFKVARAKLKEYYRYVDQHISKYCSKKKTKNSFVDLPENAMVELCKSSKLIVTSERAVYQFALIWTQQKRNRKSCKVLLQVRYHLIDPDYLMNVVLEDPLIKRNAEVNNKIAKNCLAQKLFSTIILREPSRTVQRQISYDVEVRKGDTLVASPNRLAYDGEIIEVESKYDEKSSSQGLYLVSKRPVQPSLKCRTEENKNGNWAAYTLKRYQNETVYVKEKPFLLTASSSKWDCKRLVDLRVTFFV